jgi:AraC-like DNA-binding protein
LVVASYAARPEYVVGALVEGAERLTISGRDFTIRRGDSLLIHPDEAHANVSIEGMRMGYRVFYIPVALVARTVGSLAFEEPVSSSPRLFDRLTAAHRALRRSADALEQESRFASLAAELVCGTRGVKLPRPVPRAQVKSAKAYIDAQFREGITLGELASVAGLSPYHLLRSFRREYGVTPSAYCSQLRVMEARRLLRGGQAIAGVATDVGFADQSHLNRHFQRVMGTTPGRYMQQ